SLSVQGKTSQQHALGLWLLAQDTVVKCLPWFRYEPKAFLMAAARYTRFGLHLRASGRKPPAGYGLKGLASYLLVGLMWPVGVASDLRVKRRAVTRLLQGVAVHARFRAVIIVVLVVFIRLILDGEGIFAQGEGQQFFQGLGPGDFLAFFVHFDKAHGLGIT